VICVNKTIFFFFFFFIHLSRVFSFESVTFEAAIDRLKIQQHTSNQENYKLSNTIEQEIQLNVNIETAAMHLDTSSTSDDTTIQVFNIIKFNSSEI
jgi:hypothetical protein